MTEALFAMLAATWALLWYQSHSHRKAAELARREEAERLDRQVQRLETLVLRLSGLEAQQIAGLQRERPQQPATRMIDEVEAERMLLRQSERAFFGGDDGDTAEDDG